MEQVRINRKRKFDEDDGEFYVHCTVHLHYTVYIVMYSVHVTLTSCILAQVILKINKSFVLDAVLLPHTKLLSADLNTRLEELIKRIGEKSQESLETNLELSLIHI